MEQSTLKKYPLWFQIVLGILCGLLNSGLGTITNQTGIPFFMDCIFTFTASFAGWVCGLCCIGTFTAVSLIANFIAGNNLVAAFVFSLTVFTILISVRLTYKKQERVSFVLLLLLALINIIVISLLGAIIATVLFNQFHVVDGNSIENLTLVFINQGIPLVFSSFVSRVPVNCVDKLIAAFVGYGIYYLIEKFWEKNK